MSGGKFIASSTAHIELNCVRCVCVFCFWHGHMMAKTNRNGKKKMEMSHSLYIDINNNFNSSFQFDIVLCLQENEKKNEFTFSPPFCSCQASAYLIFQQIVFHRFHSVTLAAVARLLPSFTFSLGALGVAFGSLTA